MVATLGAYLILSLTSLNAWKQRVSCGLQRGTINIYFYFYLYAFRSSNNLYLLGLRDRLEDNHIV